MNKQTLLDSIFSQLESVPSFQRIMADDIISEDEIIQQANQVEKLMEQVEKQLSPEDFELVSKLLTEFSVFCAVTNHQQ